MAIRIKCSHCKQTQDREAFSYDKSRKNGFSSWCRSCRSKYQKARRDKINAHKRKLYNENAEYRRTCLERRHEYQKRNKKKENERKNAWRRKKYAEDQAYRKKRLQEHEQRRIDNPQVKLAHSIRCRVKEVLKGSKKSAPTEKLLGCSFEQAREHLEAQFQPGMTWENHGMFGWHIDHIKPCASFDLTDPAQQRECFHYTNLQPLWAEDNMKKSAKLLPEYRLEG